MPIGQDDLTRWFPTGTADMDALLDNLGQGVSTLMELAKAGTLAEFINRIVIQDGRVVTERGRGEPQETQGLVTNNGTESIDKGAVVGRDSNGIVAPANSLVASYVRPYFISTETTDVGAKMKLVVAGQAEVKVQAGQTPTPGAGLFLSSTEPGTVLVGVPSDDPSTTRWNFIGVAQEELNFDTNRVLAIVSLSIQDVR